MGKLVMQGPGTAGHATRRSRPTITTAAATFPQLDIVDPFHREWDGVLALISRLGQRNALMLDADGWLSARQSVAAAFLDGCAISFLIFHVEPARSQDGQLAMTARLDAVGADVSSTTRPVDERSLIRRMEEFAREHATEILNCRCFDAAGPNGTQCEGAASPPSYNPPR
jgi:hypothetical protein